MAKLEIVSNQKFFSNQQPKKIKQTKDISITNRINQLLKIKDNKSIDQFHNFIDQYEESSFHSIDVYKAFKKICNQNIIGVGVSDISVSQYISCRLKSRATGKTPSLLISATSNRKYGYTFHSIKVTIKPNISIPVNNMNQDQHSYQQILIEMKAQTAEMKAQKGLLERLCIAWKA